MLNIVGRTTDGRDVVDGVFRFYETHGIPLDVVFEMLSQKRVVPCWISFRREALAAGMTHERLMPKLDTAIADSYGAEFRNHVLRELERINDVEKSA